jgi:hypothetical protein
MLSRLIGRLLTLLGLRKKQKAPPNMYPFF